ncbi:MAG: LON peptidase substrate-binding domain-containing protein [Halieaceae bacterium]|nr:LON peptidase substrate-binding domain-containing protein [Halieaceae bacterium]
MELPLFPLSTVLFPYGKMPLQIFEQRYLDLVKNCMRNDSKFGVVLIREGSEIDEKDHAKSSLSSIGTLARIVDWDQLPNGLLGITIQGDERFYLLDSWKQESGLVLGNINIFQSDTYAPMRKEWSPLLDVLRRIKQHPHVKRMSLDINEEDAWQVGFILSQLLPIVEIDKHELLGLKDIEELMEKLEKMLSKMSGEKQ